MLINYVTNKLDKNIQFKTCKKYYNLLKKLQALRVRCIKFPLQVI